MALERAKTVSVQVSRILDGPSNALKPKKRPTQSTLTELAAGRSSLRLQLRAGVSKDGARKPNLGS